MQLNQDSDDWFLLISKGLDSVSECEKQNYNFRQKIISFPFKLSFLISESSSGPAWRAGHRGEAGRPGNSVACRTTLTFPNLLNLPNKSKSSVSKPRNPKKITSVSHLITLGNFQLILSYFWDVSARPPGPPRPPRPPTRINHTWSFSAKDKFLSTRPFLFLSRFASIWFLAGEAGSESEPLGLGFGFCILNFLSIISDSKK